MKRQTNLPLIIMVILALVIQPLNAFAISPNVVITKQYKNIEELKYPSLVSAPNNKAQNSVNKILLQHIKASYNQYIKLMKEMENLKKIQFAKNQQLPVSLNI
ncbi:hypothetical protein AAHH67_14555 [Niallia circulans]